MLRPRQKEAHGSKAAPSPLQAVAALLPVPAVVLPLEQGVQAFLGFAAVPPADHVLRSQAAQLGPPFPLEQGVWAAQHVHGLCGAEAAVRAASAIERRLIEAKQPDERFDTFGEAQGARASAYIRSTAAPAAAAAHSWGAPRAPPGAADAAPAIGAAACRSPDALAYAGMAQGLPCALGMRIASITSAAASAVPAPRLCAAERGERRRPPMATPSLETAGVRIKVCST